MHAAKYPWPADAYLRRSPRPIAMAGNRGLSDEELFLNKPANEGDSPTVTIEPLRIHKPQSPRPNDRFKYPPPAGASTSATASKQPSFALPPGASSSANPLPYPDDDDHRIGQSSRPSRPPYPDDGVRKNSGSSTKSSSQQPAYNDTTPRLNTSPSEKKGPGLAERRGTAPQPLSPQSPGDDKDSNLFARPIQNPQKGGASATSSSHSTASSYPSYTKKLYYPPPSVDEGPGPGARMESSVNRYASTASTSTTRATRGSPPPPETPVAEPGSGIPGGGIEARYAAAGISGTETLSALQSQSAAAAQRLAQYGGAPPTTTQVVTAPPRPWTPTESPGQNPHGPPTVYQGAQPISSPQPISNSAQAALAAAAAQPHGGGTMQISTLEQDFQRIQLNKTPPPAYSSLGLSSSGYPNEKGRPAQQQAASTKPATTNASANSKPAMAAAAVPVAGGVPSAVAGGPMAGAAATAGLQGHPAFANDPKPETLQNGHPSQHATAHMADPAIAAAVTSPPPLPEGWIAHLDQNSGQYYYIHLATQATQWEFPKGPNPLHHDPTPLSPTASTYGNPMTSPMFGKAGVATPLFAPQTPGYAESIMSVAQTTGGFSGPPPSAGVDLYKIQPTNGVYFGPYLRYVNMDVEKGIWLGSIMIITDAPQPPTVHLHLSVDLSPNPLQLVPHAIYTHQRWVFYKFDIELKMGENGTERWTYAVTSHLGCTRYEFVVAGRNELGWRFIAHSGNDFATSTSQADRSKLGGVGFMWKDVLQKNVECGGFHVQLGLGDQIYGDRLWKEVPLLKQWLSMSGRENRKNAAWTARHEEDVTHAYFHYYTSHFDQPYLREAFAQIPHILQIDDHDMYVFLSSFFPHDLEESSSIELTKSLPVSMASGLTPTTCKTRRCSRTSGASLLKCTSSFSTTRRSRCCVTSTRTWTSSQSRAPAGTLSSTSAPPSWSSAPTAGPSVQRHVSWPARRTRASSPR